MLVEAVVLKENGLPCIATYTVYLHFKTNRKPPKIDGQIGPYISVAK